MTDTFRLFDINGEEHIIYPHMIRSIETMTIPGRVRITFLTGPSFIFRADGQAIFNRVAACFGGVTKTWRICGPKRGSFIGAKKHSVWYNFTNEELPKNKHIRLLQFRNHDTTGTREYAEVAITRETEEMCCKEFEVQLSEGYYSKLPGEYFGRIYDEKGKEFCTE